ncbi:MAG TPA: sigma-70 family RNA polymerase sigma factor [Thermoanaerobaculia bacterium]|jgi:RNA polymerase sigma-70 factor (ECF subfamily)|nr:sigma-70 family RNA polymerase sigma factor [Thermoanaerobaculia bacterium]
MEKRARFEAAALPHLKAAYNMALRLTRQTEDARDVVQETYLRAYRTFDNFRPGTNCKAWLFTILYSIFVNRYRKEKREPATLSVDELEEKFHRSLVAPERTEPGATGRPPEWTDREVELAFDELPETFREVVLLVDVEELTYDEAAAALGCPIGTIRSRLSRARKALYVALEQYARRTGYLKGASEQK